MCWKCHCLYHWLIVPTNFPQTNWLQKLNITWVLSLFSFPVFNWLIETPTWNSLQLLFPTTLEKKIIKNNIFNWTKKHIICKNHYIYRSAQNLKYEKLRGSKNIPDPQFIILFWFIKMICCLCLSVSYLSTFFYFWVEAEVNSGFV